MKLNLSLKRPILLLSTFTYLFNSDDRRNRERRDPTINYRYNKKFVPWANDKKVHVDSQLLKEFVEQWENKTTYDGHFISSYLQHARTDENSLEGFKKDLAIKRMFQLIGSTIDEIKKIELNHIAIRKG